MKLVYPQEKVDLTTVAPRDWALYLEGCLFRMVTPATKGKFKWNFVESVDAMREKIKVIGEDGKQQVLKVGDIRIDFSFPPSGGYNYKNSVLYFSRFHTRQWKKGINSSTYQVQDIFKRFYKWPKENSFFMNKELGGDLAEQFSYTPKQASNVFDVPFPRFKSAYENVRTHRANSRAISPEIFLSLGAKDSRPLVWYGTVPVGVVLSPNRIEIQLPEFEQELLDSFRDLKEKEVSFLCKGQADENID